MLDKSLGNVREIVAIASTLGLLPVVRLALGSFFRTWQADVQHRWEAWEQADLLASRIVSLDNTNKNLTDAAMVLRKAALRDLLSKNIALTWYQENRLYPYPGIVGWTLLLVSPFSLALQVKPWLVLSFVLAGLSLLAIQLVWSLSARNTWSKQVQKEVEKVLENYSTADLEQMLSHHGGDRASASSQENSGASPKPVEETKSAIGAANIARAGQRAATAWVQPTRRAARVGNVEESSVLSHG